MADVRRTPQAEADLEGILADLDQKNPAARRKCGPITLVVADQDLNDAATAEGLPIDDAREHP